MKFTSSVLAGASGSLGGAVYSHNRYGQYIRNRAIPTNPNSTDQTAVRANFAMLASDWVNVLTPAQRAAWENFAANKPLIDPLGAQIFVTGMNMYIRTNTLKLQAGYPTVAVPPVTFTDQALTPPVPTISEATQLASIAFTNTDGWAQDTFGALLVYLSRPQNPTINFFRGPYRFAGQIDGDTATPPTSPVTVPVPFPVLEDQKVFARFMAFNAPGKLSTSVFASTIVVA